MGKRAVTAEDLFRIRLVGEVALHPDGNTAVAVIGQLNREENRAEYHLWHVALDGSPLRQFTGDPGSQTDPAWSADGRWLAFLSDRSGEQQIWLMSADGGESLQMTAAKEGVKRFRWSVDGRRIAYTSLCLPQAEASPEAAVAAPPETPLEAALEVPVQSATAQQPDPRARFTQDVRVIDRSYYRLDGTGFFGRMRKHLFVLEAERLRTSCQVLDEAARQANCHRLTQGEYDIEDFDWSPDGHYIVFAANTSQTDLEHTLRQYLYQLPVPASDDVASAAPTTATAVVAQCLTATLHTAMEPRWSPDGSEIAFYGHNNRPQGAAQVKLYSLTLATQEWRCLTAAEDVWFGNRSLADTRASVEDPFAWASDSSGLYAVVSERATTQMVFVHRDTGALTRLTAGRHAVLSFSVDRARERAALTLETAVDPANVYQLDIATTTLNKRTDVNADFFGCVNRLTPEHFEFEHDGSTLDGWLLRPPGAAPASGYPTVLQVHGGPAAMYSESYFFEFQLLAAAGVAVIYTNPRGSVGYGQEFCASIWADWGSKDFADVEALADTACQRYPVDGANIAIAGGSYGGFMAAWAIGHTRRYKAAVAMRPVINWYSMVGTSDVGFATPFDEFTGEVPWEDPDRYLQMSPIHYASNIQAHTLLIHAEEDWRCPVEQSEQLFQALRYRGVPVEFVRFPHESHGLSRSGKPWHRVVRLEHIVRFLRRELGLSAAD